jgi:hypothetical protein
LFDAAELNDTGSTCNRSQTSENSTIPVMSKRNFEGCLGAESMVVHQFSKKPTSELVGNDELMKDEDNEDTATTISRQHESQGPYLHDSPEVNKQKTNKGKHIAECSNFWNKDETAKASSHTLLSSRCLQLL